jgi:hypothetical protein
VTPHQGPGPSRAARRAAAGWRWAGLLAALFLLNAALSFHSRWPTPWVELRGELSIEVALLVLALGLAARALGLPSRGLRASLALALTLLAVGRYAAVTAPALYGRPINLFWDARHLPRVVMMLVEAASPALALALGLLLGLGLVYAALHWALGRLEDGLSQPGPRRALIALAGATVAAYLVGVASPRVEWEHRFSSPVAGTYVRQAAFLLQALAAGPRDLPPGPAMRSDLERVRGAQVVVVFAESYGAVAYDRQAIAKALAASRADLAAALADTGRVAVSTFVRSPTFGGNSWLAHASLLSGVEVGENADYDRLLTQRRETLVHRFAAAGYRTLAVMPGLRQRWPEGAFYGYEAVLDAAALDYRGPDMGWWRIPDQFALARLDRTELLATDGRPRFVVFPTITTHFPFRPTPPYQPDWRRLLTPDAFDPAEVAPALAEPADLAGVGRAYADSLAYLFRVLGGWLRQRPDLDLVLLVLGDHQPPAIVSGEDASWEVPVHLITGRPALTDALAAEGFAPGLTPHRPALGSLPDLTQALLRAFGSP